MNFAIFQFDLETRVDRGGRMRDVVGRFVQFTSRSRNSRYNEANLIKLAQLILIGKLQK